MRAPKLSGPWLPKRALGALAGVLLAGSAAQAAGGNAVALRISGLGTSTPAGNGAAFTVSAIDSTGAVATGYTGTVTFSCNYPATTLPADYSFSASDQGSHQFVITPIEAGKQILDISDTANGAITGEATTSCVPGPAASYSLSNLTSGADLKAGVPATFDLTAYDAFNNVAPSYSGNAVISCSDPAATLPALVSFSAGQATGISVTLWTAGAQSVTGTDSLDNTLNDTGWAIVDVQAPATPVTPTVSAKSPVGTSQTGLTASVPAHAGMSYAWMLSGGAVTGPGGAAGSTGSGVNSIVYTAPASAGTLSISCVEINAAGTRSAAGSAAVTVVIQAAQPVITAPSAVTAGQTNLAASVVAHAGMTYAWTISGGTLEGSAAGTIANGLDQIAFTAGAAGTLTLGCAEVNAAGARSAPASAQVVVQAGAGGGGGTGGGTGGQGNLYFVAHQDDDLLFENPALEESIRSGAPTRTVFLTAAGGPDTASWQAREHGIYTSDIAMTGVQVDIYADSASFWTCAPRTYAGRAVRVCTFNLQPSVSVAFLRLPDGGLSSLWDTDAGAPFYVTPAATLTAYDGSAQYTKAQLIATLAALIADYQPGAINTQDSTFAYGDDHQDHISSALFALEAEHRYGARHSLRQFRGYNIYGNYFTVPSPEIANLSPSQYAEKSKMMVAYNGDFPAGSDYDHWSARAYTVLRLRGGTGPLVANGRCLSTLSGGSASGTAIVVAACDGSAAQRWTSTEDGLFTGAAGRCLTVGADGASVSLSDCAGAVPQRWTAFSNDQIRGLNGTCLTVGADQSSTAASLCDADRSTDKWIPLASQRFTQQFAPALPRSSGTDFSDADLGVLATGAATLSLGDVNGDGKPDACVRRSTGVWCALNDGTGHFLSYTLWSQAFSDAAGFQSDSTGGTVQLADLNGDGKADVCARSSAGLVCALANATGTGFGAAALWSSGTDFSDAAGFGGAATYYRTVHLADVNGDGKADACARGPSGIVCALNQSGARFAAATLWLADFSDASGFLPDAYGTTIQFGDIDGDGKADVCGRGPSNVRCAVSSGSAFVDAHPWSFRTDYSDAAGWALAASLYGSLRLADVNGDGRADLCARGPSGLVCAYSHQNGFDAAVPVGLSAFTDAQGFADAHGASLKFGALTGRARLDACARGSAGLVCATAP